MNVISHSTLILVLVVIAAAGCLTPTRPDNAIQPTAENHPLVKLLVTGLRDASTKGAPGNTMMFAAHRDGETLYAGFDNYWDGSIHIARWNGTNLSTEVVPVASSEQYVEHFTLGAFHDRPWLAFRKGLDTMIVMTKEDSRWLSWNVDREATSPGQKNAYLVYYPQFASSSKQLFLGFAAHHADEHGAAYRILELTNAVQSDGSLQYASKDEAAEVPSIFYTSLDARESGLGFAFSSKPGTLDFYEGRFNDTWKRTTIYSESPLGGLTHTQFVALRFGPDGTAFAARVPIRNTAGLLPTESIQKLSLARSPDWSWTDVVPTADLVSVGPYDKGLLVTARTSDAEYSVFDWRGSEPRPILKTSCQLGFVANSTRPEMVAFAYDAPTHEYQLRYVPDLFALAGRDPCK